MSAKKHAWFAPTSPRSPYKLPDVLRILQEFVGEPWNNENQLKYADKMIASDSYESQSKPKDMAFAARDRVGRAPRSLGFVQLDDSIKLTPAGRRLLQNELVEEVYLRQLLKWQIPSVQHHGDTYSGFMVKPFLEMLRLAYDLEGITKEEIAIFGLHLIDWHNYETHKQDIVSFRKEKEKCSNRREKEEFSKRYHMNYLRLIYADEIASGGIHIRERGGKEVTTDDALETKRRNGKDYADAFIRYAKATGLFTISARTYRLKINPLKVEIVRSILESVPRDPADFGNKIDFQKYIGSDTEPFLPTDDRTTLMRSIEALNSMVNIDQAVSLSDVEEADVYELKKLNYRLEDVLTHNQVREQKNWLESYQGFSEIEELFELISDPHSDLLDRPLQLEWNVWRALAMLDDGDIQGNFKCDTQGMPLATAPGNRGDIVCYYKDFVLLVEVTLSTGAKQYEMESEPILRHLGNLRRELEQNSDARPVYGLFIAQSLNEATVGHLFATHQMSNIRYYGPNPYFLPLTVASLQEMLNHAKQVGGVSSTQLLSFITWSSELSLRNMDEIAWQDAVSKNAIQWTSPSY